MPMRRRHLALALGLLAGVLGTAPAAAQKSGGVLRVYAQDSPASMSIHEEATPIVVQHVMGVFNNLVMYDQHVAQNSMADIVPDLAESWSWSQDGKDLTFKLRHGVKWHDGVAFTAADVMMSFPLELGRARAGLDEARPNLIDWLERIHARPAYAAALKAGGPYRYA